MCWTGRNLCSVGFMDSGYGYGSPNRTYRSSGYWYGSVTELTEVPGIVAQAYNSQKFRVRHKKVVPAPRVLLHRRTELTDNPDTVMNVIQYRTYRSSGYGYGSVTQLTEVPGRYENAVPVLGVLWHGRTELTEVPGKGTTVVHNLQKFVVW